MQIPEPTTFIFALIGGMLFGLASVPHCFGMCGPLHLAMCLAGKKRSFKSLTLFNLGRILGYTLIGIACGFFGEQLIGVFRAPSLQQSQEKQAIIDIPSSCCEAGKMDTPKMVTVPKSCCEAAKSVQTIPVLEKKSCCEGTIAVPEKAAVKTSCCGGEAAKTDTPKPPKKSCCGGRSETSEKPKMATVPKSCCEAAAGTEAKTTTLPKSCCEAAAANGSVKPKLGLNATARRLLMFIFPAIILLVVGMKGFLRKPAAVGTGGDGWLSRLFNKFQASGPVACGVGASLIPCGMLYVAFAFAVSTVSAFLGGVFMLFYCLTITFFMQLGIMVGTTFGKKFSRKVDRLFPWFAISGAIVYVALFIFWK